MWRQRDGAVQPVPFTDAIAYSVTDSDIGAIAHPFTIAGPVAYTLTVAIASYSIHTCIDC